MSDTLDNLLMRLKDGIATLAELEQARALVRSDERVPDELRDVVFVEASEIEADAAALLGMLGLDDLGAMLVEAVMDEIASVPSFVDELADEGWDEIASVLREGLEDEASLGVDVVEAVMRRLPAADFARAALVAPAITAEAGEVDLSDAVLAGLGLAALPLAEAVRAEAGEVDLADAVASTLALERPPVAEAVWAEAGKVDVVAGVMSTIGVWRATAAPVVAPVVAPANVVRGGRFGVAGFALAAVALLSVVVGRLAVPVTGASDLVFASAGEVQIDNLQVGTDVQVMQFEGDGGAVILWLETEV
ncbi:MAG: hypothetical protein H6738_07280 [Alphaproteobacteria bacterium]|nr:hypothetical protein [Alphaproteobacteria bacterium]MCB9696565.1 hypothetical protein [Alphaproteobacteria bacterium]